MAVVATTVPVWNQTRCLNVNPESIFSKAAHFKPLEVEGTEKKWNGLFQEFGKFGGVCALDFFNAL